MNEQFIEWVKKQLSSKVVVSKEEHGDQSDVFRIETPEKTIF